MYEKLPFPYGLVRYGVAPDHQSAKNVINKFDKLMKDDRFSFFGNISIGTDIHIKELQEAYDAVILCYGSFNKQHLNIPGEKLKGVHSAQEFVGWYNGHPDHSKFKTDLSCETAVIIGNGNVSLDIARILLSPIQSLKSTDISEMAINVLAKHRPRHIYVLGRRGPLDASFTIQEFRKITHIPHCKLLLDPLDFDHILSEKFDDKNITRPKLRIKELLIQQLKECVKEDYMPKNDATQKVLEFKFYLKPVLIYPKSESPCDNSEPIVGGIKLAPNRKSIIGESNCPSSEIDIKCGMIIKSIGFRGKDIDDTLKLVDPNVGTIPNIRGKINNHPGLYCSGWIKCGSIGDISSTMYDAFDTGETVINDIRKNPISNKLGSDSIIPHLDAKNIKYYTSKDWTKFDQMEKSIGLSKNKLREKLININEYEK
ncbi:unnamed protein product [Gordionus sp. m RMFG-2023]|uniref:NADPH:adrenodoxin oxidoreductase, mitochondrial-like n=1 Tax=Gordionus sp. m RMFG-2023 TaxID=3053472 RepID=UPI0030E1B964